MKVSMSMAALAVAAALALSALTALPAAAELKAGTTAPAFAAEASLGGKVFRFDLAQALRAGPVVLYFYPAAFTSGCTVEAHDFAEHIGDYKKLGATVIGVSGDDIAKLQRFSVSECRSKFPVAADESLKIATSYDAKLGFGPVAYANRTSYVIARDGTIAYAYTSLDPEKHVANTLEALRKLAAKP
jgi:peroxiredoxin (alkyl hydroperoxide reductase subunit C)